MSGLPPSASKTRSDVLARAAQDFPHDIELVLSLLDDYADEFESRRSRVHWVILEYSRGDLNRLGQLVDLAKTDYRDVLMLEYRND